MPDFNTTQNVDGNNEVPVFDKEDIEANKTIAGLAYLIFFLPLIVCPNSPFGKFHANQGLILAILGFGGGIILGMIPLLNLILLPIFSILVLVLAVVGLINGLNGRAQELPVIGKFRLIK